MSIFSMLFGAGIVLMTSRAEATGRGSASVHYRRMGWLILFGLLHAHLLWYGDILYFYGMCGLAAWLFRKLPAWILIPVGLALILMGTLISLGLGVLMSQAPPEQLQGQMQGWAPDTEMIQKELDAYRGGWLDQAAHRSILALVFETIVFVFFISWKAGGLMLVGMGLYKLGVFSARLSTGVYIGLAVLGYGIGLPAIAYGIGENETHGWTMMYSQWGAGMQFNYWGSLFVALGHISVVMLLCKASSLSAITRPLAAVGQMALTNYLMQTIICTTIFYGHGFGLYGSVDRPVMMAVVAGVWAVQLIWSPLWMARFRFGPFEWLWRTLTYWKLQPIRRRPVTPADGDGDAPVDNLRDVAGH
jgi:uncharacterized protein